MVEDEGEWDEDEDHGDDDIHELESNIAMVLDTTFDNN